MPLNVAHAMEIMEAMIEAFMSPRKYEVIRTLGHLISENHEAGGSVFGFYHAGTLHTFSMPKETRGQEIGGIAAHLVERANFYVHAKQKVDEDLATLNRLSFIIARKAKYPQDIRDTFPDNMIEHSSVLRKLPRRSPEGYLLLNDGTKFERLLSIANHYKATELLGI